MHIISLKYIMLFTYLFLLMLFFVQFSYSVTQLLSHVQLLRVELQHVQLLGLQHTRLPYPSPIPGACSNSYPSSQWCHPTISSSVIPFFSCLQSFPASGSFPMSQFFASGGQSIGASTSASVLPTGEGNGKPLHYSCLEDPMNSMKGKNFK